MSAEKLLTLDFSKEVLTKVFRQLPVLTSKEAGWNGIYFIYDYHLPGEIPEVGYKAGFANQGHLNYHFKRSFGIMPKAMLKK